MADTERKFVSCPSAPIPRAPYKLVFLETLHQFIIFVYLTVRTRLRDKTHPGNVVHGKTEQGRPASQTSLTQ